MGLAQVRDRSKASGRHFQKIGGQVSKSCSDPVALTLVGVGAMGAGRGTPSLSPGAEPVSGAQDLQRRAALWEWEGQRWAVGLP